MSEIFDNTLSGVLEALLRYFAYRRDALDVIGRFGNRFEGWVKWEAAIALHSLSYAEGAEGVGSIAVERSVAGGRCDRCDLFIGPKPWPEAGYPESSPEDLWIELKARSTGDAGGGAAELAKCVKKAIEAQRGRSDGREGLFLVIALVVAHPLPKRSLTEEWISELVKSVDNHPYEVRRIYWDRRRGGNDTDLLAALIGWNASERSFGT